MIKIITENTVSNDIRIIDNVEDASKSEVYGTIVAYINDDLAGTIDYTLEESDKIFYIRMITTMPEYRRQGVATEMCRYIKDNYSQYNIDWGYTTSEGEQLRKKLTKDIPNEAYTKLKQKALSLQKRLDELEAIANTDDEEEFKRLFDSGLIDKYGDEWEELHLKQQEYLDELSEMDAYKTVWTI